MTKKEMTRAQALENAIEWITEGAQGVDTEMLETVEVLKKMHTQVTKPRKRSDVPSKARIQNEALAAKAIELMEGQESVTTKWLCEHVNGLLTPQKATAVMRLAVESGAVVRNKEGKQVTYSLA